MSLSGALSIAQSALSNSGAQSAILSRNIANAGNADYARESGTTLPLAGGGVTTGPTQRATDAALLASLLSAQSASTGQQALSDGLTRLAATLGLDGTTTSEGTGTDTSPATALASFTTALQQYAAAPDDDTLASAALGQAKALATNLNGASNAVVAARAQADGDIAASVKTINGLLAQFATANTAVTSGLALGRDVSDAADARDGILKKLSNEIGVSTVPAANGGLSIYTDSGVTLFETTPRTVAFTPTTTYTATTVGGAVTVDGVPVTGASATATLATGRIAGLAALRDTVAPTYQKQLDQIASGLVSAFAETTAGATPTTTPGLFTTPGATTMPTSTTGLAATIAVNAAYDPTTATGSLTRLRDGGTAGAAADPTRLNSLIAALGQTRGFDATGGGLSSGTLGAFAASSASWIEAQRQSASSTASYGAAVASSATTALSNATGVNLDDQMSQMLDIEHAYQASAQLLNTVNSMYSSLIQAFN